MGMLDGPASALPFPFPKAFERGLKMVFTVETALTVRGLRGERIDFTFVLKISLFFSAVSMGFLPFEKGTMAREAVTGAKFLGGDLLLFDEGPPAVRVEFIFFASSSGILRYWFIVAVVRWCNLDRLRYGGLLSVL